MKARLLVLGIAVVAFSVNDAQQSLGKLILDLFDTYQKYESGDIDLEDVNFKALDKALIDLQDDIDTTQDKDVEKINEVYRVLFEALDTITDVKFKNLVFSYLKKSFLNFQDQLESSEWQMNRDNFGKLFGTFIKYLKRYLAAHFLAKLIQNDAKALMSAAAYDNFLFNEKLLYDIDLLPEDLKSLLIQKGLVARETLAALDKERDDFIERIEDLINLRLDVLPHVLTELSDENRSTYMNFVEAFYTALLRKENLQEFKNLLKGFIAFVQEDLDEELQRSRYKDKFLIDDKIPLVIELTEVIQQLEKPQPTKRPLPPIPTPTRRPLPPTREPLVPTPVPTIRPLPPTPTRKPLVPIPTPTRRPLPPLPTKEPVVPAPQPTRTVRPLPPLPTRRPAIPITTEGPSIPAPQPTKRPLPPLPIKSPTIPITTEGPSIPAPQPTQAVRPLPPIPLPREA